MRGDRRRRGRGGAGIAEVLVVIAVLGCLAMMLMIGLTRSREAARRTRCTRNLGQIGLALNYYEQATRRLPAIAPIVGRDDPGPSPLEMLLQQLGVPDLGGIGPEGPPAPSAAAKPPEAGRLPGFVCPADPVATLGVFPSPISYRANTGNTTDGRGGPFAIGSSMSAAGVEARDGAGYTAAFAERLVGNAGVASEPKRDYALVPGPIDPSGCPIAPDQALRDDAGRSWGELGWRSTLYNHVLNVGGTKSCIADDGGSALMGASSGHVAGVQTLMIDGSVRTFTRTVDPALWRAFGSVGLAGPSGVDNGE